MKWNFIAIVVVSGLMMSRVQALELSPPIKSSSQPLGNVNEPGSNQQTPLVPCAETHEHWGDCPEDWNISVSIPVLKFRQGEQAQVFQGLAVGLQLNDLWSRNEPYSLKKAFVLTPAMMMSTTNTLDSTSGNKKSDYVFSFAFLVGLKKNNYSFQIGWSLDLMSSETSDAFNSRERHGILFNVGTGF
jgi:hypothetical protein